LGLKKRDFHDVSNRDDSQVIRLGDVHGGQRESINPGEDLGDDIALGEGPVSAANPREHASALKLKISLRAQAGRNDKESETNDEETHSAEGSIASSVVSLSASCQWTSFVMALVAVLGKEVSS
jgi:hypothetical protein